MHRVSVIIIEIFIRRLSLVQKTLYYFSLLFNSGGNLLLHAV